MVDVSTDTKKTKKEKACIVNVSQTENRLKATLMADVKLISDQAESVDTR